MRKRAGIGSDACAFMHLQASSDDVFVARHGQTTEMGGSAEATTATPTGKPRARSRTGERWHHISLFYYARMARQLISGLRGGRDRRGAVSTARRSRSPREESDPHGRSRRFSFTALSPGPRPTRRSTGRWPCRSSCRQAGCRRPTGAGRPASLPLTRSSRGRRGRGCRRTRS